MNKTTEQLIKQLQDACKPIDPADRKPRVNAYLGPKGAQRASLWFALYCADVKFKKGCTLGIDEEIYRLVRLAEKRIAELKATLPVRVPAAFFSDHEERECEPFCEPVKRTRQHVWLRPDDPGLDELLSDARHYADEWGPDAIGDGGGLKRSAAATVKAIEAAIPSKKEAVS